MGRGTDGRHKKPPFIGDVLPAVHGISFEVDDDQYERLKETKKRHGLAWMRMMLYAQEQVDSERGDRSVDSVVK
ncbi:hypothetical protein ACFQGT_13765 [Natrialbaceae archaeon GCM10025810]|uniref:hypothetical protein n=1 Tax=Halovalidus salilacus TaxID=3075124 RepID=UPI00361482CD